MELIALPSLPDTMNSRKKTGYRIRAKVQATVRCSADGVTFDVWFYQEHVMCVTKAGYSQADISPETPVSIELERTTEGIRLRGVEQLDGLFLTVREAKRDVSKEVYGI